MTITTATTDHRRPVCAQCGAPAVGKLFGVSLCHFHYWEVADIIDETARAYAEAARLPAAVQGPLHARPAEGYELAADLE